MTWIFPKPISVEEVIWKEFNRAFTQDSFVWLGIMILMAMMIFWILARILFRTNHYSDVFNLGKPWRISLVIVAIIYGCIVYFNGYFRFLRIVDTKVIIKNAILLRAFLNVMLLSVIYWLITLFVSPWKMRYAVPLKYRLLKLLKRISLRYYLVVYSMVKNYIFGEARYPMDYAIAIGGTGSRCLEALIYLCAAGLGPKRLVCAFD